MRSRRERFAVSWSSTGCDTSTVTDWEWRVIVTNSFLAGTAASAFYLVWTVALAAVLGVVLRRATSGDGRNAVGQTPYALGQPA